MKSILIPTTYEFDTTQALKAAADMYRVQTGEITLFSVSEIPDSITELLFLASYDGVDFQQRETVLQFWHDYQTRQRITANVSMHHQHGMTRPVLKHLLNRFNPDLVIIPQSFQQSKQFIHQFTLKLLHQSECPLMLLPAREFSHKGIQRALYLDEAVKKLAGDVQQYPFHVIHHSMIANAEADSIRSIIEEMQIDLIVKGKRKKGSSDHQEANMADLGLPILTI